MPFAFRLALFVSLVFTTTTVTLLSFDKLAATAETREGLVCVQLPNAVKAWHFNRYDKTTNYCIKHPKYNRYWAMLNAYRSGGEKTQHWKYQTWGSDPECLENWTYYGKDGNWVVEQVEGRMTRKGDRAKRLCAPWQWLGQRRRGPLEWKANNGHTATIRPNLKSLRLLI